MEVDPNNVKLLFWIKKRMEMQSIPVVEVIVPLYQSLNCNISKTTKKLGVSINTAYKRLGECVHK